MYLLSFIPLLRFSMKILKRHFIKFIDTLLQLSHNLSYFHISQTNLQKSNNISDYYEPII